MLLGCKATCGVTSDTFLRLVCLIGEVVLVVDGLSQLAPTGRVLCSYKPTVLFVSALVNAVADSVPVHYSAHLKERSYFEG